MDQSAIVLFDGVCNLCNGAVNFVIDRDPKKKFVFASLQSFAAQELLKQFHLPLSDFKSIVLIKQGVVFDKSNAVLEITRELGSGWPILYAFKIIPKFLRDGLYELIAKHRYKLFGKRDQCRVPTQDLLSRFLPENNHQSFAVEA
ncbi:MAG: thiol-disulfide oxidoreductase DCC family protein [Cyclobacteriaceae bacterium]